MADIGITISGENGLESRQNHYPLFMAKFKKGDKVKCVDGWGDHSVSHKGDYAIIEEPMHYIVNSVWGESDKFIHVLIRFEKPRWCCVIGDWSENCLEYVSE